MLSLPKLAIILGLWFVSLTLLAQQRTDWADSTMSFLKADRGIELSKKIEITDTLLTVFTQQKNYCKYIETSLLKSRYQSVLGNYKSALAFTNECQNLVNQKRCLDRTLLAQIYLEYSLIYLSLQENNKAKLYAQKGIGICIKDKKMSTILAKLYCAKGETFAELDSQIFYYNKAYVIAVEQNDLELQSVTLDDMGYAYAIAEDNNKAIYYFKKALVVARKRNALNIMSALYNNLAGLSSNSFDVLSYLDSAKYCARLKGDLEDIQTAYQNSAFYRYQIGQYKLAYDELYESTIYKDSLYNKEKINAFAEMEQKYESEIKEQQIESLHQQNELARIKARRSLGLNFGLASALLGIMFTAYGFYYQSKKKEKLNSALQIEKKKSDDLLLNILPEEIATELKQNGQSTARQYNNVTVLFTDFVNFTGLSEQMTPTELVAEIHKNFTAFDAIIEKHGLEKIKTIGDAYLAVCGLPNEVSDHAQRVAKAALDIREYMLQNGGKFQVRLGIHSGPVVAGIVGVKKYTYDIWGDTVNTAARMESASEAGNINISATTYELIKREFECEYRGKINAKNKGEVDMWFVNA